MQLTRNRTRSHVITTINCFCHPQSDQSAQVIIYGDQKHNYLNAVKVVQLMVGKQLPISTSLINPFGTLIIDQHNQESINLVGFYHFFPRAE